MLHVLGVEAGVEVHHGFERPQVAVEEEQEQLELGVGGRVGQTLLQQADALPGHGLLPWGERGAGHTSDRTPKDRGREKESLIDKESQKPTKLRKKVKDNLSKRVSTI